MYEKEVVLRREKVVIIYRLDFIIKKKVIVERWNWN